MFINWPIHQALTLLWCNPVHINYLTKEQSGIGKWKFYLKKEINASPKHTTVVFFKKLRNFYCRVAFQEKFFSNIMTWHSSECNHIYLMSYMTQIFWSHWIRMLVRWFVGSQANFDYTKLMNFIPNTEFPTAQLNLLGYL